MYIYTHRHVYIHTYTCKYTHIYMQIYTNTIRKLRVIFQMAVYLNVGRLKVEGESRTEGLEHMTWAQ